MDKPFEEKCPKCGGDDFDYDLMEPQGEFMTQKIDCKKCGYQLTIWSENKWFYSEDEELCVGQDTPEEWHRLDKADAQKEQKRDLAKLRKKKSKRSK